MGEFLALNSFRYRVSFPDRVWEDYLREDSEIFENC
jgi:hypothetical protein